MVANLYIVIKAWDLMDNVIATRNEPVVPVEGGFMREDGKAYDWLIEDVDYPWEVSRVTVEILGQVADMNIPHPLPNKCDQRGNIWITLGPMMVTIKGEGGNLW